MGLANDPSADVLLQVAVAARKVVGIEASNVLLKVAAAAGDDPLIPPIVWSNLHPLIDRTEERGQILAALEAVRGKPSTAVTALKARVFGKVLAIEPIDWKAVAGLFEHLASSRDGNAPRDALDALYSRLSPGARDPNVQAARSLDLAPFFAVR